MKTATHTATFGRSATRAAPPKGCARDAVATRVTHVSDAPLTHPNARVLFLSSLSGCQMTHPDDAPLSQGASHGQKMACGKVGQMTHPPRWFWHPWRDSRAPGSAGRRVPPYLEGGPRGATRRAAEGMRVRSEMYTNVYTESGKGVTRPVCARSSYFVNCRFPTPKPNPQTSQNALFGRPSGRIIARFEGNSFIRNGCQFDRTAHIGHCDARVTAPAVAGVLDLAIPPTRPSLSSNTRALYGRCFKTFVNRALYVAGGVV